MKSAMEYPAVALTGGLGYGLIECLFRGWTHWTMLIAGAVCFCLLYALCSCSRAPRPWLWLAGSILITAVEFVCGMLVNVELGWNVWDYSDHFANLYGQICLLFSLLWFFLSVPLVELCRLLNRLFHPAPLPALPVRHRKSKHTDPARKFSFLHRMS